MLTDTLHTTLNLTAIEQSEPHQEPSPVSSENTAVITSDDVSIGYIQHKIVGP